MTENIGLKIKFYQNSYSLVYFTEPPFTILKKKVRSTWHFL